MDIVCTRDGLKWSSGALMVPKELKMLFLAYCGFSPSRKKQFLAFFVKTEGLGAPILPQSGVNT